jgi:biotin carboxylase
VRGVTHAEFIRGLADNEFYFLEVAARVGGAFIADVVEQSLGVNPWVEWARIEVANLRGETYRLPELRDEYAGSVLCLARVPDPDLSQYDAPEVVHRMKKHHHAGLIVRSPDSKRVESLLDDYSRRFAQDFVAVQPAPDKPTA